MKKIIYPIVAFAILAALPARGQITAFTHIIVIVQENRTPDNLFYELCQQATCSTSDLSKYDIQTDKWQNGQSQVTPQPVDLATLWDIEHHHIPDWLAMCHLNPQGTACQMDGAAGETCLNRKGQCPSANGPNYPPEFNYVQRYSSNSPSWDVLGPYLSLAMTYGWANLMFETNQGPSFPAHQFIYGATSAPIVDSNENDDANGVYAAENAGGCVTDPGDNVKIIKHGNEDGTKILPCFTHQTLGTALFGSPKPWRYYTPHAQNVPNLWTAPEAIESECGGSNVYGNYPSCTGTEFGNGTDSNVVSDPRQALVDIQNCHLQNLSWVIPNGLYSDHSSIDSDLGPQWVAAIVNSIGSSQCHDGVTTYWQDTAIIVTWDDWGGWYDHEKPLLNTTQFYQLGFRVPLLFVSAYGPNNTGSSPRTCVPYIEGSGTQASEILDFGSIDNFIEGNFLGISREGLLGFADARAITRGQQNNWNEDLSDFYDISKPACTFVPVPTQAQFNANYFINDTSPVEPPDDE